MTTVTDGMESLSFVIEGEVNVQITISELASGDLQFDLQVLDDTGSIGDLNGLFFDMVDTSIMDGLMVTGDDVTNHQFNEGSVDNLGGGVNVKGDLSADNGFDAGVRFGTSGMAKDDIQETSFTLSHEGLDLMVDDFFGQDFGVRMTSVGEEGGDRDGSLKIGDTAPDAPEMSEPTETPDPVATDEPPFDPIVEDTPPEEPVDDTDIMAAITTDEVYSETPNYEDPYADSYEDYYID